MSGAVAQGEKVIVFTGFDASAKAITAHFGDAAVLLTGATPTHTRQRLVDRFQGDDTVRVFVANLIAGGVGLTLTAARQVVFNDLDWVPANHWQAEDRAYRIGQTGTVNVSYLVATDTVDEFVRSALQVKALLVEQVVEGKEVDGAGGDLLAELERLIGAISPRIAESDAAVGEDPVDRLLREVSAAADRTAADAQTVQRAQALIKQLPHEAIASLSRVLAGTTAQRYECRSASSPGKSYRLEVDQGDVTCSCPGFEYRGACSHSRALKSALAKGGALPSGFAVAAA